MTAVPWACVGTAGQLNSELHGHPSCRAESQPLPGLVIAWEEAR